MKSENRSDLRPFFEPGSVALITMQLDIHSLIAVRCVFASLGPGYRGQLERWEHERKGDH